jgi:hypothetical protein
VSCWECSWGFTLEDARSHCAVVDVEWPRRDGASPATDSLVSEAMRRVGLDTRDSLRVVLKASDAQLQTQVMRVFRIALASDEELRCVRAWFGDPCGESSHVM